MRLLRYVPSFCLFFVPATHSMVTLSLHDALPISSHGRRARARRPRRRAAVRRGPGRGDPHEERSEEHTSELQSRRDLVCRLLLEKKKRRLRHYKKTESVLLQSAAASVLIKNCAAS